MISRSTLLFIMYDRPDYPSGPIVNYLRLLPRLVEMNYNVHVIAFYTKDYPNARLLEREGVRLHPIPHTFTEPMVQRTLEKVEEIQPDVFIPDVSTPGCFAGKWVKQVGIPVINTHRSDDALNWGKALYFSDPRFQYELSGIVCVNHYLETELRKKIQHTDILSTVIPSGVPIPTEVANQLEQGLKIVYAGRLVNKQKRVLDMLDSFLSLADKYELISFTIIGDGPEKDACMTKVSRSVHASKFQFTGRLVGEEYKQALAKQQAMVLLSDYEGTPGSLMDGMSCGLIPVCLKYNGADELIKHERTGFFVNNRNDSLYSVIDRLYYDSVLRDKVGSTARHHIIESYSVTTALKNWISFIELCKQKAGVATRFSVPKKIKLPAFNPILTEDRRLSQRSWLSRIKIKFESMRNS